MAPISGVGVLSKILWMFPVLSAMNVNYIKRQKKKKERKKMVHWTVEVQALVHFRPKHRRATAEQTADNVNTLWHFVHECIPTSQATTEGGAEGRWCSLRGRLRVDPQSVLHVCMRQWWVLDTGCGLLMDWTQTDEKKNDLALYWLSKMIFLFNW